MKSRHSIGAIIYRTIAVYYQKAKIWAIIEQSVSFSRALVWIFGVWLTEHLFENVLYAQNRSGILFFLGLICINKVVSEILSGSSRYLLSKNSYSNMGKIMVDFQRKLGKVDAIHFEEADFLDRVNRVKDCIEYEVLGHFTSACLQMVMYYFVLLGLIGNYLYQLYAPLVFIVICAFLPSVLGRIIEIHYFENLEDSILSTRRQSDYYKSTLVDRVYFKETRLLGGFHFFYQLYRKNLQRVFDKHWKIEKKVFAIQVVLSMVSFIGLGCAIALLVNATIKQEISMASFATVFAVLSQLFSLMEELVMNCLGSFGESVAQIRYFYQIMDMEEQKGQHATLSLQEGIEASDIFFNYPDSKNMVIKGIDLKLSSGKTYALVGENGSGKSTLVKILLGIYTAQKGVLRVFGVESSQTATDSLYGMSSAVFQNFQRYRLTLQDNVAISDLSQRINEEKVKVSLEKSQFSGKNIHLQQMLGPEFDGIDLSGGQWQRVAIARAMYRSHELIVLDEPTAAIDPIEESYLFNQFKQMTHNKIAIIVTHRLASTKNADEIIVLEKGTIVEKGSHAQLMNLRGLYYDMWQEQSQWYQTNESGGRIIK